MPGLRTLRILIVGCLGAGMLLPLASAQAPAGIGAGALGGERPRPLPIERAFPFHVSLLDERRLGVTWEIAADHYLYRHRFGFLLHTPGREAVPVAFSLPDGIPMRDEFFGEIEAYFQTVTAYLEVEAGQRQGASLVIEYQGCAAWGFCYPPQSASFPLDP